MRVWVSLCAAYISYIQGVPEAHVPLIAAEVGGISIDFLMARLTLSSIPDDLSLQDDNLLRNLDERCVRSLNGEMNGEIFAYILNRSRFPSHRRNPKVGPECGSIP